MLNLLTVEDIMSKLKSPEDLRDFVVDRVNKRGAKTVEEAIKDITAQLEKLGYVSPRTGRPLSTHSVRSVYFHGIPQERTSKQHEITMTAERAHMRLETIKSILAGKEPDSLKVKLIQALLNSPA